MTDWPATYIEALAVADRAAAVAVARSALADGMSLHDVLIDLVCTAQTEVGRQWQGNNWNVAREHAATAVSESVVSALTAELPVADGKGHVIVACVEGEWHALPARVVSEILRLDGWTTTFLGASTPPAHLAQYLHDTGPDAVALSCSLATALPRARRMIEATREAGVPVVVGGRGFGPDDLRARRLGANAWAMYARDAAMELDRLSGYATPPPRVSSPGMDEYVVLTSRHAALVDEAYTALLSSFPPLAGYSQPKVDRTREDLGHVLEFLAAALFVDDARIFDDFVVWLVDLLESRSIPAGVVVLGFEAVDKALPELARTSALLRAAAARLST